MKSFILAPVAALVVATGVAVSAQAQEPRLLGCYQRALVPAQYNVKKTLIKEAERKYIKRNGRYELVEYPPVYHEERTIIRGEYYIMQEIPCD